MTTRHSSEPYVRLATPVIVKPLESAVHVALLDGIQRHPRHASDERGCLAVAVLVELTDEVPRPDAATLRQTARRTKRGYTHTPTTAR
jgi:hypothetical protein